MIYNIFASPEGMRLNDVFTGGKYKGRKLGEILTRVQNNCLTGEKGYLNWAYSHIVNFRLHSSSQNVFIGKSKVLYEDGRYYVPEVAPVALKPTIVAIPEKLTIVERRRIHLKLK